MAGEGTPDHVRQPGTLQLECTPSIDRIHSTPHPFSHRGGNGVKATASQAFDTRGEASQPQRLAAPLRPAPYSECMSLAPPMERRQLLFGVSDANDLNPGDDFDSQLLGSETDGADPSNMQQKNVGQPCARDVTSRWHGFGIEKVRGLERQCCLSDCCTTRTCAPKQMAYKIHLDLIYITHTMSFRVGGSHDKCLTAFRDISRTA